MESISNSKRRKKKKKTLQRKQAPGPFSEGSVLLPLKSKGVLELAAVGTGTVLKALISTAG